MKLNTKLSITTKLDLVFLAVFVFTMVFLEPFGTSEEVKWLSRVIYWGTLSIIFAIYGCTQHILNKLNNVK